jgi:tripartite-type tricarboxylate transporter receptor subunit TctC
MVHPAYRCAHADDSPRKISYGSTGIGSSNHLSMELFKSMAGIDLVHSCIKAARRW